MEQEACCTCATLLSDIRSLAIDSFDEKVVLYQHANADKSIGPERRLPCCSRVICTDCIRKNPRFETYCPFCQITNEPSVLPQRLRDPPEYSSRPPSPRRAGGLAEAEMEGTSDEPPAYTPNDTLKKGSGESGEGSSSSKPAPDVIHHLESSDTISSLSLAYGVPASVLRNHNAIFSDHLISARRTISIPGSHYKGESLSPNPVDDPEERERKAKIRKFMVGAKCHKYEEAELYLKQADGDVDKALERWKDDEKWEKENPLDAKSKAKMKMKTGGGLSNQLL